MSKQPQPPQVDHAQSIVSSASTAKLLLKTELPF
jgi:hypothetical protein